MQTQNKFGDELRDGGSIKTKGNTAKFLYNY